MKDFTHVSNFPKYMEKVADFVRKNGKTGQSVLDIPAGNGLFSDKLRAAGFIVTCGDINSERPHYVHANMESELPFEDESFDFVTCMEGVEHVINPSQLIKELSRVTKKGGHVVISTPNVQNLYTRLTFLLTGTLYQFNEEFTRHPNGEILDRGHISPLTYLQLNYLFKESGLSPKHTDGDRVKKKILIPIYLPLAAINELSIIRRKNKNGKLFPYQLMNNWKFLLSRSLIASWQKPH